MEYIIRSTKTNAGTRKLPITEDVGYCFRAIIEDRPIPKVEKFVDGYSGFLYLDKDGMPEVAMHWQHRFNHAVQRYNDIYRVQMPNITPHVCRHTYCSNHARAGMNPKTLQYLMGHSEIGVTMNTYIEAAEQLKGLCSKEIAGQNSDDSGCILLDKIPHGPIGVELTKEGSPTLSGFTDDNESLVDKTIEEYGRKDTEGLDRVERLVLMANTAIIRRKRYCFPSAVISLFS